MSEILDVAAQGDLVIRLGENGDRQLVRVNTTVIREASPVFNVMLGPSFREGNTIYGAENPLDLSMDNAQALINLFWMTHFKNDNIEKHPGDTHDDLLVKLAIVCDKYHCAERFRDYFVQRLDGSAVTMQQKVVIYGMIKDKSKFVENSSALIRCKADTAITLLGEDLSSVLPYDTISKLKQYRRRVHDEYQATINEVVYKMLSSVVGKPCAGIRKRIANFLSVLHDHAVTTRNSQADRDLVDMPSVVRTYLLGHNEYNFETHTTCGKKAPCACDSTDRRELENSVGKITGGRKDTRKLCWECYIAGSITVVHECDEHC